MNNDLMKEPFTGSSINEFEVKGYDLRKSTDRNEYRHFKQHVYCAKESDKFRKNQSRLDTVKHYSPCLDVWEYFPA